MARPIRRRKATSERNFEMKEIQIEFFQDKKSIHWMGGQPYARETYYFMGMSKFYS